MTDSINDESLDERPEDGPSPSPDQQRDYLSFMYDPIDGGEPCAGKDKTNQDICNECYGTISNDSKLAAAKTKDGTGAKSKNSDDVPATSSIASVHLLRDMQRILRKSYHQGRRDQFLNDYEVCVARYAVHISHTIQSNDEQLRLGLPKRLGTPTVLGKEDKKKNRIASVRVLRDLQRSFRTSFNQRRDGQVG